MNIIRQKCNLCCTNNKIWCYFLLFDAQEIQRLKDAHVQACTMIQKRHTQEIIDLENKHKISVRTVHAEFEVVTIDREKALKCVEIVREELCRRKEEVEKIREEFDLRWVRCAYVFTLVRVYLCMCVCMCKYVRA